MNATLARRLWVLFETYHDVTYFTPESRAANDALGCKGGWMGYFATRAAPLGAASPELVVATFYNFHPSMVRRALPEAWQLAEPRAFLAARLAGADGSLRRMLGQDTLDGAALAEAAELAVTAANAAQTAGRPLGAANAAVPMPEAPHLALWQATTTLRESRGDGHVAALVAAGLDPSETLVLFAADKDIDPAYMRAARKWSEQEWQAAADRLTERKLIADGAVTAEGHELRTWIENTTDQCALAPWEAIGQTATDRFIELVTPLALSIAVSNEALRTNPMGLDAVRELA